LGMRLENWPPANFENDSKKNSQLVGV